jgi:hypothetical protein
MPAILTEDLAAEWISDGLTEERITEIAPIRYQAKNCMPILCIKIFIKQMIL